LDVAPTLRVRGGRSAASGGRYAVTVESDNAPAGARVELRLGRAGLGGFEPDRDLATFPAGLRRRVGFALADKALAFTAAAADPGVPVGAEGVEGRRLIQARLVGRDGRELLAVVEPVAFDATAPGGVRILDPPARARPGAALELRAVGSPSASGTKSVSF